MNILQGETGKNNSSVRVDEVDTLPVHPTQESVGLSKGDEVGEACIGNGERTVEEIVESKKGRLAYFKTRDFYIVLILG